MVYAMLCDGKDAKEIAKLDADLEGEDSDAYVRLQVMATTDLAALMGMAG